MFVLSQGERSIYILVTDALCKQKWMLSSCCAGFQHIEYILFIPKIFVLTWRSTQQSFLLTLQRIMVLFCKPGQGIYLNLLQDWECLLVWIELISGHFQVRLNSQIHYKLCLLIELSLSYHRTEWIVDSCMAFLFAFLMIHSLNQTTWLQICCKTALPFMLLLFFFLELYWQTSPNADLFIYLIINGTILLYRDTLLL